MHLSVQLMASLSDLESFIKTQVRKRYKKVDLLWVLYWKLVQSTQVIEFCECGIVAAVACIVCMRKQ